MIFLSLFKTWRDVECTLPPHIVDSLSFIQLHKLNEKQDVDFNVDLLNSKLELNHIYILMNENNWHINYVEYFLVGFLTELCLYIYIFFNSALSSSLSLSLSLSLFLSLSAFLSPCLSLSPHLNDFYSIPNQLI